jgi:hypothetical protein
VAWCGYIVVFCGKKSGGKSLFYLKIPDLRRFIISIN